MAGGRRAGVRQAEVAPPTSDFSSFQAMRFVLCVFFRLRQNTLIGLYIKYMAQLNTESVDSSC